MPEETEKPAEQKSETPPTDQRPPSSDHTSSGIEHIRGANDKILSIRNDSPPKE